MYTPVSIILAVLICFGLAIIIQAAYRSVSLRYSISARTGLQSGNGDEAIAQYSESLAHQDNPELRIALLLNRGNCYSAKGNVAASLADYSEAIEIEKTVIALRSRGACHFRLGKTDLALTDINEAHLMDPTDAETLFYRSVLYRRIGNAHRGALDMQAAMAAAQTYPQKKANILELLEEEYRRFQATAAT